MQSQHRVFNRSGRALARRPVAVVLALALGAALGGCSTVQIGHDYDLATFQHTVHRGVTTQAQIRGWLGAPTSTGVAVHSDGTRFVEWTYYYGQGSFPDMSDARLKLLQIRFDAQGVVQAYNWSGGS